MTLLFYQNVKLGPTPHFIINPPPPRIPILGFFDFIGNRQLFLRQDRPLLKNKKEEQTSRYKVETNYHSLKMPKALLSSFRAGVLLTLFFNLVCFLVFVSRA